ncbi:MAG: hypothetical protein IJJ28_07965, partial [Lentisphaeria bacterium]|nr:hypothetical protein [Lentisphaeria bacterium]
MVGSTIANTNIVGSDTYAKRLNVSGAEVTVTDLKVSSGGSIYLYDGTASNTLVTGKNDIFMVSGGVASNTTVSAAGSVYIEKNGVASDVTLTGVGGTTRIAVSNGGVASGVETTGTGNVEIYINASGTIRGLTAGSGGWTYVNGGTLSGGTINGVTFQINGGTVSGVTIYKRKLRDDANGWRDQLLAGTMIDCTLATSEGAAGAIFRQTGGTNNNFTVTGSGAVFYASGGTVNDVTVTKGGTLELSKAAVVNDVHAVRDGRTTTVRVNSGGTINGIDNDGEMQIFINNSGTVNDMMLGANAYVFVTNGAVVSGGSTWGVTLEINGANAVVEDLTILKPTQRADSYAGNDQLKAGTMSNCTLAVLSGASVAVYRQTGGTNIGMTVTGAGAEFNVSGGTLTGTTVTSGGELNVWGGSFTNTTIESGGALYASDGEFTDLTVKNRSFLYLRGATVNNLQMLSAGSHPNVQVSSGTVINGGANTGTAEFWVYNGGVAKDMTLNTGAYVMMNAGGTLSGGTFNGAMLEIMGATVRGVTILKADSGTAGRNLLKSGKLIDCTIAAGGLYRVSGGTATNTKVSGTFNISAGTVDGVTVYDGGRANISAAATGVVESGGYVNIVNNAEVSFVETELESHTFVKAATLHEATTADNATVASGATLHVVGGQANNATVEAGGNMVVSSGVVRDLTLNSGAVLDFAEGAWSWGEGNWPTVTGVTVNSGARVNLKNFTRLMDFTVVSGAVLKRESNLIGFGGSNTNIAKGVFFDAKGVEEKSFGEDFQVVNGVATGLELNGNNPRSCAHIYSGLTAENARIVSGGSLYVFSGAAIDGIGIYGSRIVGTSTYQAYMYASNAGIDGALIGVGGSANVYSESELNDLTISGGAVNIYSGVTADNVTLVSGAGVRGTLGVGTGATVNTLNLGIKGDLYVNGGTVNDLIVSNGGNTPTFYVYNGGTVVGGKTTGTCEVRASNGGVISGMEIGGGAYVHIRSTGSAAGVLSDCVFNGERLNIYEGGVVKDVTIVKTADGEALNALRNGSMIDCTIASGAQYKMSGGVAENTLVKGTFLVRGGVASNLRTSGNRAFVNISSGGVV